MYFILRIYILLFYFIMEMCCVKRKYVNGEFLVWDIMIVGVYV